MKLAERYYTMAQLAKSLGVTRQTISRWVKSGKLIGEKVGRQVLFDKHNLPIKQCPACKRRYWSENRSE